MRFGAEPRQSGDDNQTQWELREFFLQKVAEIAPEVLEDLRTDVLPVFENAYEATQPPPAQVEPRTPRGEEVARERPPEWIEWQFRDGDWEDADDWPEELVALWDKLYSWAGDQNLLEPWVLDAALRTLTFWYAGESSAPGLLEQLDLWKKVYSPTAVRHAFSERDLRAVIEGLESINGIRPLRRFYPLRFTDVFEAPPFTFEFRGWSPQHPTWRDYEQELRATFEEELERYKERRRERPEGRELESLPEVRAPYHFEWLVLWQVQEKRHWEIAEEYGVSIQKTTTGHKTSSGVGQAIHDKADLLGLTRRTEY